MPLTVQPQAPFRNRLIVLTLVLLCLAARGAAAGERWNSGEGALLLHGFDPVSYFDGTPTLGQERYAARHSGARILFATAENLQRFRQDPERFLPAYGGYCAYGVRMGKKFDIDPLAWAIVDGKLYLMLDRSTRALWQRQRDQNIKIANRTWQSIRNQSPEELESPT